MENNQISNKIKNKKSQLHNKFDKNTALNFNLSRVKIAVAAEGSFSRVQLAR